MNTNNKRSITASFFLGYFKTLSSYGERFSPTFNENNSDLSYIISYLNFFRDDFYKMINSKNGKLFLDWFDQNSYSLCRNDLLLIVDFIECNYIDINYVSLLLGEYLALVDFDSLEIFDKTKFSLIMNEVFTNLDLKISWKKVLLLANELDSAENVDQKNAKDFIFASMLKAVNYKEMYSYTTLN